MDESFKDHDALFFSVGNKLLYSHLAPWSVIFH